jgi:succinate dehydrogenase / fumarate reductase, iron-sulfur subunit
VGGSSRRDPRQKFKVYRWNPDHGQNPRLDVFRIALDACRPLVLDALIKIKHEIDPTFTFRRSCRADRTGSSSILPGAPA